MVFLYAIYKLKNLLPGRFLSESSIYRQLYGPEIVFANLSGIFKAVVRFRNSFCEFEPYNYRQLYGLEPVFVELSRIFTGGCTVQKQFL